MFVICLQHIAHSHSFLLADMFVRSLVCLPIVILVCVWQVRKNYTYAADGGRYTELYGKKAEEMNEIVKHIESRQKADSDSQNQTQTPHLASRRDILAPLFSPRLSHLQEVCATMTSEEVVQTARIWSVNPRYKLAMCRTAKHGSTTWASLLVQLYSRGGRGGLPDSAQEVGEQVLLSQV